VLLHTIDTTALQFLDKLCDASAIVAWGCIGEFVPISETVQGLCSVLRPSNTV